MFLFLKVPYTPEHTHTHTPFDPLYSLGKDKPNKTVKKKTNRLVCYWMHVDYAFVYVNFVVVLQFRYFMIQCVRMDYPCMYLCIYFYKTCTEVCVQIFGQNPMDVTGFLFVVVVFFFPSSDSIVIFCCFNKILHERGVICKMSLFTLAFLHFVFFFLTKHKKGTLSADRQSLTHLLNMYKYAGISPLYGFVFQ